MSKLLRRLFAAFLCLSLTLPNSAWALRAGLEGTVEHELSAGLEEPATERLIQKAKRAADRLLVALSKQKDFFEIQDHENNRIYISHRLAARLLKNDPSHRAFIMRKPRSEIHPMVLAINNRLETLFASSPKSISNPTLRTAVSRLKKLGISGVAIQSKTGLFRFWTKARVDKAIQLSQKGRRPLSLQPDQITSVKQKKSPEGRRLFGAYNKITHKKVAEYSAWSGALAANGFDAQEIYQTPLDQLRAGGQQEEISFYVNPRFDEQGRLIPGQEPLLKKQMFTLSSAVAELVRLSPVPIETIGLAGIQAKRRKVGTDGLAMFILNRQNYSAYLPKSITADEVPLLILLRMDDPYLRPQQARVLKSGASVYPDPSQQQQVFLNARLSLGGGLSGNPPLYVAAKSIGTALREDPDFKKASAVVITGVATNEIGGTARFRNPFAEDGDPSQLLTTARYESNPPLRLNLQVTGTSRKTVEAAFNPEFQERVFPRPNGFDFRKQRNGGAPAVELSGLLESAMSPDEKVSLMEQRLRRNLISYSAAVDFLRFYHDETLPDSAGVSFERYLAAAQQTFSRNASDLFPPVLTVLRHARQLQLKPTELPFFFQFKTRELNENPELSAGLEEVRDLTEEILGRHPFQVGAFGGNESNRFRLFVYDHSNGGQVAVTGLQALPLGAQLRMIHDGVSGALLLKTLAASGILRPQEWVLFAGFLPDRPFKRAMEGLVGEHYNGSWLQGMKIIDQLKTRSTTYLLESAQAPGKNAQEKQLKTLVLLALVYKLRGYLKEARAIDPIRSIQRVMEYFHNGGDYQPLIDNINRVLENPRGNPRRSSQSGIQNISEIESLNLGSVKEGNATFVYRAEVTLKNRPGKVFFVVNAAKDATLASEVATAAWPRMKLYYETDPLSVMEPYFSGEAGGIAILTGEWVEGDEIHLYVQPDGRPQMRIWTHQSSPGELLSGTDMERVWETMVRMQARYSSLSWGDEGSVAMVRPARIALNAGDLVWHLKPDGSGGPLLIWPWSVLDDTDREAFEWLARSLLAWGVDQESQAPSHLGFWGQPEKALQIAQEEMLEKLRAAAQAAEVSPKQQESFAQTHWRQMVRSAAAVLLRDQKHPEEFLQERFFSSEERRQTQTQIEAAQIALQTYLTDRLDHEDAGLEERAGEAGESEPAAVDVTPLIPILLKAIATTLESKQNHKESSPGGLRLTMEDGVVSISAQTLNKILLKAIEVPAEKRQKLRDAFAALEVRLKITERSRAALSNEKPFGQEEKSLWEKPAAQFLRGQGIWRVQVVPMQDTVEFFAESAYNMDSAMLAVQEVQRRIEKNLPVTMDEVWMVLLLFHNLVLRDAADQTFDRFLDSLKRRFPEEDRNGDFRNAALTWKRAYPILLESAHLQTANKLERLFFDAADQIEREIPKGRGPVTDFSPSHTVPPSSQESAGLEESGQHATWERTDAAIRQALADHPGGDLTAAWLGNTIGVSRTTLVAHRWREHLEEENSGRGPPPLKPLINPVSRGRKPAPPPAPKPPDPKSPYPMVMRLDLPAHQRLDAAVELFAQSSAGKSTAPAESLLPSIPNLTELFRWYWLENIRIGATEFPGFLDAVQQRLSFDKKRNPVSFWNTVYPVLQEAEQTGAGDAKRAIPELLKTRERELLRGIPGAVGKLETRDAAKILRTVFIRDGRIDPRIFPFLDQSPIESAQEKDARLVKAFLALMAAPSADKTALPPLSVPECNAGPFSRNEISEEALRDYVATEWTATLEKILRGVAEQITRQQPATPVAAEDLGFKQIQSLMRSLSYAEDSAGQRLFPNLPESEIYRWSYRDLPQLLVPLIAPGISRTFILPGSLDKALADPLNLSNESGNRAAVGAIQNLLANQPGTFTDDPAALQKNPLKTLLPWLRLTLALNLVDYSQPVLAREIDQADGVMQYVLPRLETPFSEALGGERFMDSFIDDILKPNRSLVHIPDNNVEIVGSLKLAETLLSASPTLKISMIVKADNGVMNDASMEDAKRLLEKHSIYTKLREYRAKGRFRLIPGAKSHGTPLNHLTPAAVEALSNADLVLSEGEANTWNLNGLAKPIYLGLRLKWLTGVKNIFGVNPDPERPPAFIKIDGTRGAYFRNSFGAFQNVPCVTIRETLAEQSGLEEMARAVNALREVPTEVPGSVGDAVLVFAGAEETGDSLVLAVQQGWTVALLDGRRRAAGLEDLLRALPGSNGRYAIGVLASGELLKNRPHQIFIEDDRQGRQKVFRILGLHDLPAPVAAALESVLAYLDRATSA